MAHTMNNLFGVHEQQIGAASCTSRLESHWEAPNFDPRGAKTSGGRAENG